MSEVEDRAQHRLAWKPAGIEAVVGPLVAQKRRFGRRKPISGERFPSSSTANARGAMKPSGTPQRWRRPNCGLAGISMMILRPARVNDSRPRRQGRSSRRAGPAARGHRGGKAGHPGDRQGTRGLYREGGEHSFFADLACRATPGPSAARRRRRSARAPRPRGRLRGGQRQRRGPSCPRAYAHRPGPATTASSTGRSGP